mgnify:CR=1 FL=1
MIWQKANTLPNHTQSVGTKGNKKVIDFDSPGQIKKITSDVHMEKTNEKEYSTVSPELLKMLNFCVELLSSCQINNAGTQSVT